MKNENSFRRRRRLRQTFSMIAAKSDRTGKIGLRVQTQ